MELKKKKKILQQRTEGGATQTGQSGRPLSGWLWNSLHKEWEEQPVLIALRWEEAGVTQGQNAWNQVRGTVDQSCGSP